MINFYYNYCIFYTFCIICFLITFLMSSLTHWLSRKIGSSKKASPYECGFNAFSSAHTAFDVHFFVVALLFLVFDIELMFLYPWSITMSYLNEVGIFSVYIFLLIVIVGYIYEWKKGALNWVSKY